MPSVSEVTNFWRARASAWHPPEASAQRCDSSAARKHTLAYTNAGFGAGLLFGMSPKGLAGFPNRNLLRAVRESSEYSKEDLDSGRAN